MESYQGIQQLVILKIEKEVTNQSEETILFCGYAGNQEEAIQYMEDVQKEIDFNMRSELQGEYIVVPALYFNLKKRIIKKESNENGNQKGHKQTH
jgi:hypothetical protein